MKPPKGWKEKDLMPKDEEKLIACSVQFNSVAQSCPSLWPHGPQHTRPPYPSPTPRVHPNPCPLSR